MRNMGFTRFIAAIWRAQHDLLVFEKDAHTYRRAEHGQRYLIYHPWHQVQPPDLLEGWMLNSMWLDMLDPNETNGLGVPPRFRTYRTNIWPSTTSSLPGKHGRPSTLRVVHICEIVLNGASGLLSSVSTLNRFGLSRCYVTPIVFVSHRAALGGNGVSRRCRCGFGYISELGGGARWMCANRVSSARLVHSISALHGRAWNSKSLKSKDLQSKLVDVCRCRVGEGDSYVAARQGKGSSREIRRLTTERLVGS